MQTSLILSHDAWTPASAAVVDLECWQSQAMEADARALLEAVRGDRSPVILAQRLVGHIWFHIFFFLLHPNPQPQLSSPNALRPYHFAHREPCLPNRRSVWHIPVASTPAASLPGLSSKDMTSSASSRMSARQRTSKKLSARLYR